MNFPNETTQLLPRRRLMGLIFCAGTGLLLGARKADAMWSIQDVLDNYLPTSSTPSWKEIPPALRGVIGGNGEAYARFLSRIGLRRMSVQAIIDSHAKAHGLVHNTLPPRQMWGNIRNTLRALDSVAVHLGEPVGEVVSVYRSPAYNATCPGAKSHSYHMRNNAVDVRFNSSPRKVSALAREMRHSGLFQGGIGRYPGFTHIDTRGKNVDW